MASPRRHPVQNKFQSTLSKRRATNMHHNHNHQINNFNPRSPSGERQQPQITMISTWRFQSTLSKRRATKPGFHLHHHYHVFQSTLSKRRATIDTQISSISIQFQSTLSKRRATADSDIALFHIRFQSTLSKRRATCRL